MMAAAKNTSDYLDGAINLHMDEKSAQLTGALAVRDGDASVLEIGPGGGIALMGLANGYSHPEVPALDGVRINCLELFPSESATLSQASLALRECGAEVEFFVGAAGSLPFDDASQDIVNCSAVLHEVYSYAGGTDGVTQALAEIARVTKPGGSLLFRDVYPVDLSIHTPIEQIYSKPSWRNFVHRFIPYYLEEATHDYASNVDFYDDGEAIKTEMPVGLAREVQRHYITFRDHVMRTGLLGAKIDLDRFDDTEWLRTEKGFEKKIYLAHTDQIDGCYLELHEDRTGVFAVASDFDDYIDQAMSGFFMQLATGDSQTVLVFNEWLSREGRESYVYGSVSSVIDSIRSAGSSASKSGENGFEIVCAGDLKIASRDYYTEYLRRVLRVGALPDKKLIVNFTKL